MTKYKFASKTMAGSLPGMQPVSKILLAATLVVGSTLCVAADEPSSKTPPSVSADSGLYLKVQLANPVKLSKLKPGDKLDGDLRRDVYSSDRKVYAAGSQVSLTVDHLEKRKRPRNDHWPWVVNFFTPRHENFPVFKTATMGPSGSSVQVSLLSVSRMRDVHALAKKGKPGEPASDAGAVEVSKSNAKPASTLTVILEATDTGNSQTATESKSEAASTEAASPQPETIPAGTQCKILLLGNVSASKSQPGDVVQARLLEPVLLNSKLVLPAGTLFEGKVLKKTPPRWLSRAGSLYLTFTEVILPHGSRSPITASLAEAELDEKSHTKIDAEGRLHGEHPGKAWMAINLGVSAGLAKVSDDTMQLIIEAIVSTATDVSTAGSGRIAAGCVSGIFMVTRHGRDVILPRFTEMAISLDRPLSITPAAQVAPMRSAAAGGK